MKCWNCGAQNPKTAKVCKKCGSDLTQPKSEEIKTEGASTGQKVHPVIWIVIGVAAIALIITILLIVLNIFSPKKQGAAVVEPTSIVAAATTAEESGTESSGTEQAAATISTLKSKGEGCDYDTCAWMSQDQL
jgi:ribosomal protein L40E